MRRFSSISNTAPHGKQLTREQAVRRAKSPRQSFPAQTARSRSPISGGEKLIAVSGFPFGNVRWLHHFDFPMTSAQIRQSFLDYFREKQHTIVPSASLLPDSPNLLFTNAGMNQFVPIFLGQQKPPWNPPRVADTQKCIRAGGKHNDLDDVGLDTYHHTFFEMLGNWSFGDYFKKEAIEWAWELVIERWKLPPQRLYATVYKPGPNEPSEFDQEAHDHWARLFENAGLDSAVHVVNGNKMNNFWMMGDTGPCGPCSELHIDLTPAGDTKGSLVNAGDPRCIEIWNLVFIQFNAAMTGIKETKTTKDASGFTGWHVPIFRFDPLPQRHVDTGMGFERITAMIQGTKNFTDFSRPTSNYETDIFRPIFDEIEKLSGKKYGSTLPIVGRIGETLAFAAANAPQQNEQEKIDVAFRVIADHVRTLSFAIGDGILPSNEGRGYVLRRILRRAIRYGRTLDFHEPFFFQLVDVVAQTMGDVFSEIRVKQRAIKETIQREEKSFNQTLDRGIEIFEEGAGYLESIPTTLSDTSITLSDTSVAMEVLDEKGRTRDLDVGYTRTRSGGRVERVIRGDFAFQLYDTYGFPFDLTELMARERGLTVDKERFEMLMEEQRERGRRAQKRVIITAGPADEPTKFVGFEEDETEARLLRIEPDLVANVDYAILNLSPMYAEMGGQVGDTGIIVRQGSQNLHVDRTSKRGETFYHRLDPEKHGDLSVDPPFIPDGGEPVCVRIDGNRRRAIERHHTVTHLLHWALHEMVSREAAQKGSYVGPDKLTFDFSSAALTPQQKRAVEKLVNEKIVENAPVSSKEIPYVDAKKRSDIQQFFGDKYGDDVRVLQIGGEPERLNGYSMELCGGTHVRATGDIGSFRILSESAIAAGVRRIEAVAGDAARDWAKQDAGRQQEKFEALARKKNGIAALPTFTDNAETNAMLEQIDARSAHLEKLEAEVHEWEKQHAKASEADLRSRAGVIANELAVAHAGEKSCVGEVPNADAKLLQAVVDALKPKFGGPIFLAGASDGRVALVASVPKELTSKVQANTLIQEVAPIVGGKGGGRPEAAQGAGKDATKIGEALARATELISL
jgi:alanyl-tRNA synthetase